MVPGGFPEEIAEFYICAKKILLLMFLEGCLGYLALESRTSMGWCHDDKSCVEVDDLEHSMECASDIS